MCPNNMPIFSLFCFNFTEITFSVFLKIGKVIKWLSFLSKLKNHLLLWLIISSSESTNQMYFPLAILNPLFLASDKPKLD